MLETDPVRGGIERCRSGAAFEDKALAAVHVFAFHEMNVDADCSGNGGLAGWRRVHHRRERGMRNGSSHLTQRVRKRWSDRLSCIAIPGPPSPSIATSDRA